MREEHPDYYDDEPEEYEYDGPEDDEPISDDEINDAANAQFDP